MHGDNGNNKNDIILDRGRTAKIHFGTSYTWDNAVNFYSNSAKKSTDISNLFESMSNGDFDIKSNKSLSPEGAGTGRLLDGYFASARSAGNYLAGMIGSHVDGNFSNYMKKAGAYHVGGKFGLSAYMLTGSTYGRAPWYGEINYAGRMIVNGWLKADPTNPTVLSIKKDYEIK